MRWRELKIKRQSTQFRKNFIASLDQNDKELYFLLVKAQRAQENLEPLNTVSNTIKQNESRTKLYDDSYSMQSLMESDDQSFLDWPKH